MFSRRFFGSLVSRVLANSSRVGITRNASSAKKEFVKLKFIGKLDETIEVDAQVGDTLLEVAQKNALDVEGACEGSMACSTCHMIFEPAAYKKLPAPSDEEQDLIDLAASPEDTSRLGCQVIVSKDLDGATIRLPKETVNRLVQF
eukprot:TRINITY_DN6085_c0_g1_i1.p1 TRINITY_DN6085_c0_g1~~TRINITY_DN6085_c0_g1_i1.p1  ORF type:complete len:145 (-),score=11.70 TRINITY_DN6085_c0_g1_i1:57-491(-)